MTQLCQFLPAVMLLLVLMTTNCDAAADDADAIIVERFKKHCERSTHLGTAGGHFDAKNKKCYKYPMPWSKISFYDGKNACRDGTHAPIGWDPRGLLINATRPEAQAFMKQMEEKWGSGKCSDRSVWVGPIDPGNLCCMLYSPCDGHIAEKHSCNKKHHFACEYAHPYLK